MYSVSVLIYRNRSLCGQILTGIDTDIRFNIREGSPTVYNSEWAFKGTSVCVKLHLRYKGTYGRKKSRFSSIVRPYVRPFVRLSLCALCLSGASILWSKRTAMLHRILMDGE